MALLERVSTLIRANLNDLIDKAEDPEKMIKQVILDMENQLLQVKTQVAISMADHHLLQKKQAEHEDKAAEWMRKAELAVDKTQDDLARGVEQDERGNQAHPVLGGEDVHRRTGPPHTRSGRGRIAQGRERALGAIARQDIGADDGHETAQH